MYKHKRMHKLFMQTHASYFIILPSLRLIIDMTTRRLSLPSGGLLANSWCQQSTIE